jgi:hypothetical protein
MHEQRRVRFEEIDGLRRSDLEAAGEVWLADVCAAPWASREATKLAAFLVSYMNDPEARQLSLPGLEAQVQIGRDETKFALRLLKLYRAISAFTIEGMEVRVALRLTTLQRLRVLEARFRLAELIQMRPAEPGGEAWVPQAPEEAGGAQTEVQGTRAA